MWPWQPFVMNVLRSRKVKKLAYLLGYWLDLAQIWCRGLFLDSISKINNKFLYHGILTSKWREGYIACRKCIWKYQPITLCLLYNDNIYTSSVPRLYNCWLPHFVGGRCMSRILVGGRFFVWSVVSFLSGQWSVVGFLFDRWLVA